MNYRWKMGDGNTSSDTNMNYTYSDTGSYQVQLTTTTEGGCKDSVISMIYVKPNPDINLGKDTTLKHNQTINLDAGAGMDSYIWSTNASTQQITVDTTGVGDTGTKMIWVKVEKNGCSSYDTALIHFIHNYAISEGVDRNTINVYPNPATNEIFILSSIPKDKFIKVTILNEYGKIVSEVFTGSNNGKLLRVDATIFASGVYFVKIESEAGSGLAKVVIIK